MREMVFWLVVPAGGEACGSWRDDGGRGLGLSVEADKGGDNSHRITVF
jgi:hypothetical protein